MASFDPKRTSRDCPLRRFQPNMINDNRILFERHVDLDEITTVVATGL